MLKSEPRKQPAKRRRKTSHIGLYGVISQKIIPFIVTVARNSNLTTSFWNGWIFILCPSSGIKKKNAKFPKLGMFSPPGEGRHVLCVSSF
jgi:hypothetical protein